MGQYYKAVFLNKDKKTVEKSVSTYHPFRDGAKLMEHSYIDNLFTNSVEKLLLNNPSRLVWAGDYANDEKGKKKGGNLYHISSEQGEKPYSEMTEKTFGEIWNMTDEQGKEWFPQWAEIKELGEKTDIYVLNHDKKVN